MKMKKIKLLCIILALIPSLLKAEPFLVQDIQLQGAKRIKLSTLLSYLPIKKGDEVDGKRLQEALSVLYKTGWFNDVEFLRQNNTLIVNIDERPAIAEVNIDGNNKLPDETLKQAFDDADLVAGRIYNPSVLNKISDELESAYYSYGRYGVKLDTKVTELSGHRVKVDIDIKEGRQAKIKHINIVGNKIFSDEQILDEIKSGIPSWWAIFSSKDKYEKNKLNGDLEAIKSYYLDRGYLDFKVESTQVSISNDKKDIFVTINLSEGKQYTIDSIQYAGDLILTDDIYDTIIGKNIKSGDVFSRKKVNRVIDLAKNQLGIKGYPFAEVNPLTQIDKDSLTVGLIFNVDPKQKIYVNRILFAGNEKTVDKVYRRELRQMENALYNAASVERSRVRIQRLEYVENVSTKRVPSADRDDAVDIIYEIRERLAGSFNAGLGLSDNGTSFNLSISQTNVFGTGNALSLGLSRSDTVTSYNLSYRNPYYRTDNLSRTLTLSYREFDATEEDISADFLLDSLSLGARYGMPLSEYSRLTYGVSVGTNDVVPVNLINIGTDANPELSSPVRQIQDFINENDNKNDFLRLSLAYSIDRRDRRIFARRGSLNRLTLDWTTPVSDLAYYKFSYLGEKYFYTDYGSLLLNTSLSYGEGLGDLDRLPFYEKYLAGGIRTLRGFESRSIGPLEDRLDSITPDPIGGDLSTLGSVEWLFNFSGGASSSQFSLFYDFGSVFEDGGSFDTSEFRSSYGFAYNWLSPLGPLVFSYAFPLEKEPGDVTERFQFTIGTSF